MGTMGADVNYVEYFMRDDEDLSTTPLIEAASKGRVASQEGHLNVVRLLVQKGANIQIRGSNLFIAGLCGHNKIMAYLTRKGSNFAAQGQVMQSHGRPLANCSRCYTIYYCSPECRSKDWSEGGERAATISSARG